MYRRLVFMVAFLACGFAVPVGMETAVQESRELFVLATRNTGEIAALAESALAARDLTTLRRWLDGRARACGCAVFILDHRGMLVVAAGLDLVPGAGGDQAVTPASDAMAGRAPVPPHVIWLWDRRPFVLGAVIRHDGRPLGAAVTMWPTDDARSAVAVRLLLLAAVVGLTVLAAATLVIGPLARWVMTPVRLLGDATEQVGSGYVRVPETAGPPEVRRLACGFNDMADRVLALATRQRDFVAQASHQLRNPITALRLRVENAFELGSAPYESEDLKLALNEVDRLCAIVDSLLLLAKSENNEELPVVVDVSATVVQRVDAWRSAYDRNSVPLITNIPDGVRALCLPELIEHGLDALLDNALKFGEQCPVRVVVQRRGDMIDVVVRDQGPGLPAEELEFVGTRFWRSTRHQNLPGTGLGLAIIRRLAKASGGQVIMAASRPHGLEVRLRVSAAPAGMGTPDGHALR
ncbi:HAMP domain-containing sensor histidine kinase [Nonomuraea sp. NPDC050786]|uniref:sensor histidine kinase n=1 Tax=Nonomuraea sp. NPDC050786 TaxID=3154840 RepID=UPI0033DAD189